MLDALLLLRREPLLHLALQLGLLAAPLEHRLARFLELLIDHPQLLLHLLAKLRLLVQLLRRRQTRLVSLLIRPAMLPKLVGRDQLRLRQARARLLEQLAPLALRLELIGPRDPAARQLTLADAPDGHLLRVLDAFQSLCLELFGRLPPRRIDLGLEAAFEACLLGTLGLDDAHALVKLGLLALELHSGLLDGVLGHQLCLQGSLSLRLELLVQLILLIVQAHELVLELLSLVSHAARRDEHSALRVALLARRLACGLPGQARLKLRLVLRLQRRDAHLPFFGKLLLCDLHRLGGGSELRLQLLRPGESRRPRHHDPGW